MIDKPPAYAGDGKYSFACYSHRNAEDVFADIGWLNENEINVWYDEGIQTGSEWSEYLANKIAGAERFIFFASADSVASKHCRGEIQFAFTRNIPFVIVYLEKTPLSAGLELALGSTQALVKHELSEERYRRKLVESFGGAAPASAAPGVSEAPARPHKDTIAVLPFFMSGGEDNAYFGEGIAEEILNRLARAREFRVVARSSSFRFNSREEDVRDIARALGASHIVDGSVSQAGGKIRISASLTEAADASQVWGEAYLRESADVFALQDEIAENIAGELRVQLAPVRPTKKSNFTALAHDAYLKGSNELWKGTRASLYEAMDHFSRAVNLDPDFADAYALLAYAYMLNIADPQADRFLQDNLRLFKGATFRALELDPESDKANLSMAMYRMSMQEWETAERHFIKALSINRHDPRALGYYGYFLANTRRLQKGARYGAHAVVIDPFNCHELARKAQLLSYVGEYEAAIEAAQRALAIDPEYRTPHVWLASCFSALGDHEAALHSMTRWNLVDLALREDEAETLLQSLNRDGVPAYLRDYYAWLMEKRRLGARTPHLPWFLAVYATLNNKRDEAFGYLEEAWSQSLIVPDFPFLDPLRRDPRWERQLARIGLGDGDLVVLEASANRYRKELAFVEPA
ncbi:MAG: TIR domain-containing protein [Pseudomonadota bacterium]